MDVQINDTLEPLVSAAERGEPVRLLRGEKVMANVTLQPDADWPEVLRWIDDFHARNPGARVSDAGALVSAMRDEDTH